MTRDRNGLIVFAALMLAGCLVLLAVTTSRSLTAQSWQPYRGGWTSLGSAGPYVSQSSNHHQVPFGDAVVTPSSVSSPSTPQSSPSPSETAPDATKAPKPTGRIVPPSVALRWQATWWDSWGHGFYAAAGPKLRALYPDYLGKWVTACAGSRCVRVRLTTSCACQPDSRIIDLSLDAFSRLADPSLGVLEVTVSW